MLVGAGKMGSAMLEGWLALGLDPASVTVIEPSPAPEVAALTKRGVRVIAEAAKASAMKADTMDTIVLAVKPQVAPAIMAGLKPLATAKTVDDLDHGRADHRRCRRRDRRRGGARDAEHAGRDRSRHDRRGGECRRHRRAARARPRAARGRTAKWNGSPTRR